MARTVITSQKFIGNVVSRLVKYYDRIEVVRDKTDGFLLRVVATSPAMEPDDFGGADPVVVTGFTDPPPNCS